VRYDTDQPVCASHAHRRAGGAGPRTFSRTFIVIMHSVPCAICGGTATSPVLTKFDLPIARCTACGLVYANPRLPPEEIWKRYSPDYFWNEYLPALGVVDGQFDLTYFDHRYSYTLQQMALQLGGKGRVLEIGCGAGFFLKAAERNGWDTWGIELSEAGSTFARERLGLRVRREQAEQAGFDDGSFDIVVMFDVIEHLLEPIAILRTAHRVLRPGGAILISTPNLNALSRTALGDGWAVLSPGEHLYYFTEATLTRGLESAGFGGVRFIRENPSLGVFETMNPRYTHAPQAWRTLAYDRFVRAFGGLIRRQVQARGRADALWCWGVR
jgi:SAM-dependent methyltransferase